MRETKRGFTLVEILVVIFIIGLLSTIAAGVFGRARAKARDSVRVSDVRQLSQALELYYNDRGGYPLEMLGIVLGVDATTLCDTSDFSDTCVGTKYHGNISPAPTPADGSCTEIQNRYDYTSDGTTYAIDFCLGGDTGSFSAGPRQASPAGIQ